MSLLSAAFVAVTTGIVGISAYFNVSRDSFVHQWIAHLAPAVVLAFALLGLAGGLVVQDVEVVGAERGWFAAAHVIAPASLFATVALSCLGRNAFHGQRLFTPGLTVAASVAGAISLTAIAMLAGQQLRRHPRGRRRHLFWLMSMDTVCVAAIAALVFVYLFLALPG